MVPKAYEVNIRPAKHLFNLPLTEKIGSRGQQLVKNHFCIHFIIKTSAVYYVTIHWEVASFIVQELINE